MGTRSTIIALALLTGCNYDYGILGYAPAEPGMPLDADDEPVDPIWVDPVLPTGNPPLSEAVAETEEEADEEAPDTDAGEDTGAAAVDEGSAGDTDAPPPTDPEVDPLPPEDTGLTPVDTGYEPPPIPPDDPPAPPDDPPLDPPSDPPPPPPPTLPEHCSIPLPSSWEVQTFPGGRESMVSHVGDIDGDGLEDAAWVNQLDSNVSILWGVEGGADPLNPSGWSTFPIGRSEGYISWGDWDGDGRSDIIASNQDNGRLRLLRGAGGRAWGSKVDITVPGFPQRVLFHDATGDGFIDILIGDGHAGSTTLMVGAPGGSFAAPVPFIAGSGQLRGADLDGDGWDELIASVSGAIYTYSGSPYGAGSLPLDAEEMIVGGVWPFDLDGDGDLDILAHGQAAGAEGILGWKNVGGSLERCGSTPIPFGIYPSGLGDLDGDGIPDITSQTTCGYCSSTYAIAKGRP